MPIQAATAQHQETEVLCGSRLNITEGTFDLCWVFKTFEFYRQFFHSSQLLYASSRSDSVLIDRRGTLSAEPCLSFTAVHHWSYDVKWQPSQILRLRSFTWMHPS